MRMTFWTADHFKSYFYMATELKRIRVRRGTAAELAVLTPASGEPCWTTDEHSLSMGDGTTLGAILSSLFTRRVAKTGAYTVLKSDKNKFFELSGGTWTLGFAAAATLGDSWACAVFNSGTNPITLDPNGSEVIRDAAGSSTTKSLAQGEGGVIVCNGTSFLFMRVTEGGGLANPMSQAGAMIIGGTGGTPEELAPGTDFFFLMMVAGSPAWVDPTGFLLPATDTGSAAGDVLQLDTSLIPFWGPLGAGGTAASVSYSNATSGLSATNVQDAIDEVAASGGGGSGTKTLYRWRADEGIPPAAAYATYNVRNARPVMEFDDTADESLLFYGIIPQGADLSSGIKRREFWKAKTATSGNIISTGAFERGNTDSDADSFATGIDSAATAVNGTSGITTVVETNHSSSEIDGLTVGDDFYLKITRKATSGSDTVSGDMQLVGLEIQQIA